MHHRCGFYVSATRLVRDLVLDREETLKLHALYMFCICICIFKQQVYIYTPVHAHANRAQRYKIGDGP